MWITGCDCVCTSEVGGTGWNRVEPGGTIRNPATAATYYIHLHTTFLLLRSLALFFLYPSLASLLSFSLTYFLLSFFQISSCPFLFPFSLFFRNDFAVETPAFFELFFLRTRDQSRCKRYVLNGDLPHVEF